MPTGWARAIWTERNSNNKHGRDIRSFYTWEVLSRSSILAIALLAAVFLYTWSLNRVGIITPDEPRYAAIARNMAVTGDYVSPVLWGEPWFEKPALLYWLSAAGYRMGLPGEFAPRLPVALLSVLFLGFFYFALSRVLASEETAGIATAMLATSVFWFAFSQVAVTDLPLAATFNAGLLCLLLGWRWTAAVLFGLSLLAKGLVAPLLLLPTLWLVRRDWRQWVFPALAGLAVAALWYVPITLKYGMAFWQVFFIEHHLGRFAKPELQHVQPVWFYLPVILGAMMPWTVLAVSPKVFRDPRTKAFVWTALWGLFFFSMAKNKLPGYLLPLLPSLCVLGAVRFQASRHKKLLLALCLASLTVVAFACELVPAVMASGLNRNSFTTSGFHWWFLLFGLLCIRPNFQVVVAATFVVLVWFQWSKLEQINSRGSARLVWAGMKMKPVAEQCVEAGVSRSIRYGLNYYAERTLPPCPESGKPND